MKYGDVVDEKLTGKLSQGLNTFFEEVKNNAMVNQGKIMDAIVAKTFTAMRFGDDVFYRCTDPEVNEIFQIKENSQ